ncbi:MAG: protein-L-isoaspartate(D-aspartate) O-methyltransferase [Bacteroidales bacterium]|nr:protein-L-isoaspartate(D-aspartate) O-methyltransferase [Bacteroidales bacterium]MBR5093292.1 protein-L-isoaspartate(D-aspartate) O-methyltransferase [Bacteroidales bacterium]
MMQDTFKHKGLRQQMVDTLRANGISDEAVLKAMNEVPRHFFIDSALDSHAYEDRALKIGCEQTISHPSTVAMQSQLLALQPGMKVLEIGTGSGYQTAVLCRMGAKVFTVERQKGLFDQTRKLLSTLRYNARCFLGDGYQGLAEVNYGPYDRIIVTCGAPEVPEALMAQLKVGGIMVIPLGDEEQEMLRITKEGAESGEWKVEKFGTYSFVPMLNGKNMKQL